jgi:adenylate kinase
MRTNDTGRSLYMRLVLLGGPGAGKGTQASKMREHYGIPHVSTGEILREARAAGTELGIKAGEYMDAGKLLPDDIILGIIDEKMPMLPKGFLFDGFPRTIGQSEALDRLLKGRNEPLDSVVSIEVPDELVINRLLKRAEIEGRADDNRETIQNRLRVYYEQTEPLKAYYRNRGILRPVDGVGTVDEVFERIKAVLGE